MTSARRPVAGPIALAVVRLVVAAVFLAFGVGKFTNHASELASFREYGLPGPDASVYLIGTIEIVGGALLVCGVATPVTCLVLASVMVGAIVVSGLGRGETVSLTVAPAQLAGLILLLWRGPGRWKLR